MQISYWRHVWIRAVAHGFAVAVFMMQGTAAIAGPWPRTQGALLLIERNEMYIVSRDETKSSFAGDFQQFSTNLYAEYGLTSDITIGGKLAYLWQQNAFQSNATPGEIVLDNIEGWHERLFYVQTSLPTINNTQLAFQLGIFSGSDVQTVSQSIPNADHLAQLEEGVELRVLAGRNLTSDGRQFVALDTGIRQYAEGQGQQVLADFTYGWHATKNIMLLLRSYNTISPFDKRASPENFDLSRFDPSLVVKTFLGRVEIGAGKDVYSRNLDPGLAYYIGYWTEY